MHPQCQIDRRFAAKVTPSCVTWVAGAWFVFLAGLVNLMVACRVAFHRQQLRENVNLQKFVQPLAD